MNIVNCCMSNKFENLDKTDKFLAKYKRPASEQEDINRSITIKEPKIISNTYFPKNFRPKSFHKWVQPNFQGTEDPNNGQVVPRTKEREKAALVILHSEKNTGSKIGKGQDKWRKSQRRVTCERTRKDAKSSIY